MTIRDLTVADGKADGNSPGLAAHGGGILNEGNLTLIDVVVSHNRVIGDVNFDHGAAHGGGIANSGTLTVTGSTFIDNQALGATSSAGPNVITTPGAVIAFPGLGLGGGLDNEPNATATVTDSYFTDNLAQGRQRLHRFVRRPRPGRRDL